MFVPLTVLDAVSRYETTFKGNQPLVHSLHLLNSLDKASAGLSEGIEDKLIIYPECEETRLCGRATSASSCLSFRSHLCFPNTFLSLQSALEALRRILWRIERLFFNFLRDLRSLRSALVFAESSSRLALCNA